MKGETRPGAKVIPLVVNEKLLKEFDALGSPQQRSRRIEAYMWREVMHAKFGGAVSEESLAEMRALSR